jgi:hypothetical protein
MALSMHLYTAATQATGNATRAWLRSRKKWVMAQFALDL